VAGTNRLDRSDVGSVTQRLPSRANTLWVTRRWSSPLCRVGRIDKFYSAHFPSALPYPKDFTRLVKSDWESVVLEPFEHLAVVRV
jgi:hypothetical protein